MPGLAPVTEQAETYNPHVNGVPATGRSCLAFILALVVSIGLRAAGDARFPVVVDGKLGFIDASGAMVIPPRFFPAADMAHFAEGLAPVAGPDGAGYIEASARKAATMA